MSSKYNFVSIKRTIAKVYRDFNIKSDARESDMIEWSGEALHNIGISPMLVDESAILKITNYRVRLPFNFEKINALYLGDEDFTKETEANNYRTLMRYAGENYRTSLQYHQSTSPSLTSDSSHFYKLDGNFIKTSIDDRFIYLLYKAYPLDNEGYPIIPDSPRVHEAISQWIIYKLISRGWKHPAGMNFFQQKSVWEESCARAKADLYMPDVEDYRRFEQTWVRLIPKDFNREEIESSTRNAFHQTDISEE